jgi:hypothetical protein
MSHVPAHDPQLVAELAQSEETRILRDEAAQTMVDELGLQSEDVWTILQQLLSPSCAFYKSMPAKYVNSGLLDVYHVSYAGTAYEIYVKLSVVRVPPGTMSQMVVVWSFKKK